MTFSTTVKDGRRRTVVGSEPLGWSILEEGMGILDAESMSL